MLCVIQDLHGSNDCLPIDARLEAGLHVGYASSRTASYPLGEHIHFLQGSENEAPSCQHVFDDCHLLLCRSNDVGVALGFGERTGLFLPYDRAPCAFFWRVRLHSVNDSAHVRRRSSADPPAPLFGSRQDRGPDLILRHQSSLLHPLFCFPGLQHLPCDGDRRLHL